MYLWNDSIVSILFYGSYSFRRLVFWANSFGLYVNALITIIYIINKNNKLYSTKVFHVGRIIYRNI